MTKLLRAALWVALFIPVIFTVAAAIAPPPVLILDREKLDALNAEVFGAWSKLNAYWELAPWKDIEASVDLLEQASSQVQLVNEGVDRLAKAADEKAKESALKKLVESSEKLRASFPSDGASNLADVIEQQLGALHAKHDAIWGEGVRAMSSAAAELDALDRKMVSKPDSIALYPQLAWLSERLTPLVTSLFPWPIVVIVIALLAMSDWGSQFAAKTTARIQSFTLAGLAVTFSDATGQASAEKVIEKFKVLTREEYDRAFALHSVDKKFDEVVRDVRKWLIERSGGEEEAKRKYKDARFTLWAPFHFTPETLYQLLDYRLGLGDDCKQESRGRLVSQRFGIIGLAYRSREFQSEGQIPTDDEVLVKKWGMTRREAAPRDRQSMTAVPVTEKRDQPPAGVIFFDDKGKDQFFASDDDEARNALRKVVDDAVKKTELLDALRKVEGTVTSSEIPRLTLFG